MWQVIWVYPSGNFVGPEERNETTAVNWQRRPDLLIRTPTLLVFYRQWGPLSGHDEPLMIAWKT